MDASTPCCYFHIDFGSLQSVWSAAQEGTHLSCVSLGKHQNAYRHGCAINRNLEPTRVFQSYSRMFPDSGGSLSSHFSTYSCHRRVLLSERSEELAARRPRRAAGGFTPPCLSLSCYHVKCPVIAPCTWPATAKHPLPQRCSIRQPAAKRHGALGSINDDDAVKPKLSYLSRRMPDARALAQSLLLFRF